MPNINLHTNFSNWSSYGTLSPTIHIQDEVHLVRIGEKRSFDRRIASHSVDSNVPVNVDPMRNTFYIPNGADIPTDSCGFVRVVVSYTAHP